jgi:hypothetical protein
MRYGVGSDFDAIALDLSQLGPIEHPASALSDPEKPRAGATDLSRYDIKRRRQAIFQQYWKRGLIKVRKPIVESQQDRLQRSTPAAARNLDEIGDRQSLKSAIQYTTNVSFK